MPLPIALLLLLLGVAVVTLFVLTVWTVWTVWGDIIIPFILRPFISSDAKMVLGAIENWARTRGVDEEVLVAGGIGRSTQPIRELKRDFVQSAGVIDAAVVGRRYDRLKETQERRLQKAANEKQRTRCAERAAQIMMGGD